MIELEQSPIPNQLLPDRSDSWAIVFSALQEDLISNYALYHPTHSKPRPGGHKILFNEYAAKLINPENPPCSRNSYFGTGPQSLEAHGGRLLASLGTPMTASAELREVLQD